MAAELRHWRLKPSAAHSCPSALTSTAHTCPQRERLLRNLQHDVLRPQLHKDEKLSEFLGRK
jgi:hypothetical protein